MVSMEGSGFTEMPRQRTQQPTSPLPLTFNSLTSLMDKMGCPMHHHAGSSGLPESSVHSRVCMHACGGQRLMPAVFFDRPVPYFLRYGHLSPELTSLARLAGQQVPEICLCPFQTQDSQLTCLCMLVCIRMCLCMCRHVCSGLRCCPFVSF